MSKNTGRGYSIGLQKEASGARGTLVSSSIVWFPQLMIGLQDKHELAEDTSSVGVMSAYTDSKVAHRWAEGDFEGNVRDVDFGHIIRMLTGSASSSVLHSGETTVYDHTFTTAQNNAHDTYSFFVYSPVANEAYSLCQTKSLELTYDLKEFLKFKASLQGRSSLANTAPGLTRSFAVQNQFVGRMATMQFANNSASIGSALNAKIIKLSVKHEKPLEDVFVLGNIDLDDLVNGPIKTTIEFEIYYEDNTLKALFDNNTKQYVRVKVTDPSVTLGSASNPTIQIDLPQASLDWSRDISIDKGTIVKGKWTAEYSLGSGFDFKYLFTNTNTSYA